MKITVVGAGATGGFLAVKLVQAGHDLALLTRDPRPFRTSGVTLKTGAETTTVRPAATADANELGPQDLVLVTVKSAGLVGLAPRIAPLVGPGTSVAFLQNGLPWWYPLGQDDQSAVAGAPHFALARDFLSVMAPQQVYAGIVMTANETRRPGVVLNNSAGKDRIDIGAVAGGDRADRLCALLSGAGIRSDDIGPGLRRAVWSKLAINCSASLIAALVGGPSSLSRTDPALRRVCLHAVDEILAIAAACGEDLSDLVQHETLLAGLRDHKPSMRQDLEAGRATELAESVFAPLALARHHEVPTPTLDVLSTLLAALEATGSVAAGRAHGVVSETT